MRQIVATLTLMVAASLLGGCVYNPYTGAYQPCCGYYPYPYSYPYGYRYPPPYYTPYGNVPAPYGTPPPVQPGAYPYQQPGPGAATPSVGPGEPDATDTERKYHLTLAEARAIAA